MFVLLCLVSVEFCDVEVVVSLDDIGNTPLVELKRLARNGGRMFSKCEFMNPSGSHKDRTYLNIIT